MANQKFSKILQISKILCLGLKELYIFILTERKLKVKLSMKYCLKGKQLNFHVIIMHTAHNTGVNRRLRFTDPMFQLNTPWKRQKTRGILTFSGVQKWKIGLKWVQCFYYIVEFIYKSEERRIAKTWLFHIQWCQPDVIYTRYNFQPIKRDIKS